MARASGAAGHGGRPLARLCGAAFLAYCSYSLCRTPLLPLFAQQLGAGPSTIGLVVGASTVTGIFVKLPAGALSDVLGRRPLLLAGALVFALLPFGYLAVSTLGALVALRFVHGHATAIFGPVASATVSDMAPPDRRGAWLATYATTQGMGQAVGPILAGYLLASGRFDLAFLSAGVISLAVPLVVARLGGGPARAGAGARWPALRDGVREVLSDPLILLTSAAHAAQFVVSGALSGFLPLYARDVVGLTTAEIGWLFAAQTATTLLVRPLVGRLSDSLGRRGAIVAGLGLSSAMVWLMAGATTGWALTTCTIVYAAGVATTSAAASAFITDLTRRARYGAAHGVFGTIYDVGDALGPIGAGLVVSALGYESMLRLVAGVGLGCAVAFAAVSSTASRPTS
jgi:MFS family permease